MDTHLSSYSAELAVALSPTVSKQVCIAVLPLPLIYTCTVDIAQNVLALRYGLGSKPYDVI